jgi:hypothetical protein
VVSSGRPELSPSGTAKTEKGDVSEREGEPGPLRPWAAVAAWVGSGQMKGESARGPHVCVRDVGRARGRKRGAGLGC